MSVCTPRLVAQLVALGVLTGFAACGGRGPLKHGPGGADAGPDAHDVPDSHLVDDAYAVPDTRDAAPAPDLAPPDAFEGDLALSSCVGLEPVLGQARPLFGPGDAANEPIVFKRADGALVTRGAGRLHVHQEIEPPSWLYQPGYFENLSYGFTIEDFTVVGQQRIRVTYLPLYVPGQTQWKAWKAPGNNSVFMVNDLAVDVPVAPVPPPVAVYGIQVYDQTTVPAGRKMEAGELFEFELGVVSKDYISPFTDTFRYRIGEGGLSPENRNLGTEPGPRPETRLGGDTTTSGLVFVTQEAFAQPALNIQIGNIQDFLEGRRLFHTDFVTGANVEKVQPPNATFARQAGKAGPRSNTTSCAVCHARNGRGTPIISAFDETSSMVFRLYGEPSLGAQLQPVEGVAIGMGYTVKTVQDVGGPRELHNPRFVVGLKEGQTVLRTPAYSARVAPPLIGLGLLEAIDDRTIASRADRLDCDHDGISGRVSLAQDATTGGFRVGRFGWKAEKVSVAHQVAEDAVSSLDVGSNVIRDSANQSELDDADLGKLTTYMRLIGVPPRRASTNFQILAGQAIFASIGCANCHVPTLTTSPNHPFAELRAQEIHPYTDLLLHDLGPDLADQSAIAEGLRPESPPAAGEWRTTPLWGLGLRGTVGHAGLLHDGRASGVVEAILWHSGEAESVTRRYLGLSNEQRGDLVTFLESL